MVGWWSIASWARPKAGHSPHCWPMCCSTKWTWRWRREATASPATPTTACVYVGSTKAGERGMAYLRKLYTGLKLQINDAKSAVASAFGRKFLGYALWVAQGREVKCKVAVKALGNFKARVRQLTRRSGGRSMSEVVEKLRPYLLGWKAYFGLVQTPGVWRGLDEWLRHRLRAIQLWHWRRPKAIYRELKALGAVAMLPNKWRETATAGGATAPNCSTAC